MAKPNSLRQSVRDADGSLAEITTIPQVRADELVAFLVTKRYVPANASWQMLQHLWRQRDLAQCLQPADMRDGDELAQLRIQCGLAD